MRRCQNISGICVSIRRICAVAAWVLFFGVLSPFNSSSSAQPLPGSAVVPDSRRIDWQLGTNVGVRGGIPTNRTVHCATLDATASADQINSALATCPAGQVVKLGAGTFIISKSLKIPSNVTLRGSGVGATKLNLKTSSFLSITGGGSPSAPGTINDGYVKGSTLLTITSTPSLAAGDFIAIYQDDEEWVYKPHGGDNHIYSLYRVESVKDSAITIWPKLVYAGAGKNPKFAKISQPLVDSAGIEELSLYPESDVDYPIYIGGAYQSWVRNVSIHSIPNIGVYIFQSLGVEIAHVDVLGSQSTGDGYGIVLDSQTKGNTAVAIYNCILDGLFHGIMSSGQQGSVFAYNYTLNEHAQNGTQTQTAGFNASHSPEGMMSLWEGNFGNFMTSDYIHGGAAYQTVWRSRFTGINNYFNLSKNAMFSLTRGSYYWNIVGNILGDSWATNHAKYKYEFTATEWDAAPSADFGGIYMLGYVGYQQPLDPLVKSSALRYFNYDYWHQALINETPGISGNVDPSLAWPTKPSWFGDRPWPPFDPNNPAEAVRAAIPAGYRYEFGRDPPQDNVAPRAPHELRVN